VNDEKRPDITIEDDGWQAEHMKYEATVPQDFVQRDNTTIGRSHTKDKGPNGFGGYGIWK
jgi:hypothetical protein